MFILTKKPRTTQDVKSVMYRVPEGAIRQAFNAALVDSGRSAQDLVNAMVQHCLKETCYLVEALNPKEGEE